MSTLSYAVMTTKREEATPGTSRSSAPPGVKGYADAVAALVPAEVLSLHAVILAFTTETGIDPSGNAITTISEPGVLKIAFWGLVVLSIVLYVIPRWSAFGNTDWIRVFIAPVAFVVWTMVQRATAFDAFELDVSGVFRTVVGLLLAVLLAAIATALAGKADAKPAE